MQCTAQPNRDNDQVEHGIATKTSTNKNSNHIPLDKSVTHVESHLRSATSQLEVSSSDQRSQTLENGHANPEDENGEDHLASIDTEQALPDDSPLTYIGGSFITNNRYLD